MIILYIFNKFTPRKGLYDFIQFNLYPFTTFFITKFNLVLYYLSVSVADIGPKKLLSPYGMMMHLFGIYHLELWPLALCII